MYCKLRDKREKEQERDNSEPFCLFSSFLLLAPLLLVPLNLSFVKTFSLKKILPVICSLLLVPGLFFSCTTMDLYEKTVTIPRHEWQSSFRPSFDFTISDTTVPYKVYLVLRHNEQYHFNNIYVNLYIKGPGRDTAVKIQRDLPLATPEKGWLGSGMDDIYEHRITLSDNERFSAGAYTFTIEQIMREDPLQNVLNAGLRLEKAK